MDGLDNKNIVLTRDVEGNTIWGVRLKALGAKVYSLPTIETVSLELTTKNIAIAKHLSEFDWIIFTSAKTVSYFYDMLDKLGARRLSTSTKFAAIGPRTARQLEIIGARIDFLPSQSNSMVLGRELSPVRGKHILLPRTDIAPNELMNRLTDRGARVIALPLYTTRIINTPDADFMQKLRTRAMDSLIFASPSAVHGFSLRITDPELLRQAKQVPVVAIGPSTQAVLRKAGFQHIYTSPIPSIESIIGILQRVVGQ